MVQGAAQDIVVFREFSYILRIFDVIARPKLIKITASLCDRGEREKGKGVGAISEIDVVAAV